jgi:hypothetical protein
MVWYPDLGNPNNRPLSEVLPSHCRCTDRVTVAMAFLRRPVSSVCAIQPNLGNNSRLDRPVLSRFAKALSYIAEVPSHLSPEF